MTLPTIKLDWTVNVSSLVSAVLFLFTIVGAWYNLKEEVAVNKTTTELKFAAVDSTMFNLRDTLITTTSEIKTDIRELRSVVTSHPEAPRPEGRWQADGGHPKR